MTHRAGRGLLWLGLERGLSFVVTFGCGVALARLLPPEDFGVVAFASAVFLPLGRLSGVGIQQEIVRLDASRADFREIVGGYGVLNAVLVLCVAVVALCVSAVPGLFVSSRSREVFFITVAGWSVFNVLTPSQAMLQKAMRFGTLSVLNWASALLGGGGAVVCAVLGWGVWSLVVPQMCVLGLSGLAAYACAPWRPALGRIGAVWQSLRGTCLWYLNAGFTEEAYQRLDDILVGRVLGNRQLAFYRRAYNLGGLFHHGAGTVLTRVLFPLFAHQASGTGSANARTFRTAVSCVGMVLTPAVCLATIHADFVVGTVYGDKWLPCVPLFRILGGYAILLPIFEITKELLVASGGVRESARAYWTMLGTLAVALGAGLPWFGVPGAAVAVDVALFAGLVHASVAARRIVGISVFRCVWRAWVFCGAGVLVFILFMRLFPGRSPLVAFAAGIVFWAGLSCAMLWVYERPVLMSLLRVLMPDGRAQ